MSRKTFVFTEINKNLTELCIKLDRIPTKEELKKEGIYPDPKVLRKLYKENTGFIYSEYFINLGFEISKRKPNPLDMTFDDLCYLWEEYFIKHGKYPNTETCLKDKTLPYWGKVVKICGDRFEEFKQRFKNNNKEKTYEEYCQIFIEISNKIGRPLTILELNEHNEYSDFLPSGNWFMNHCPSGKLNSYSDFLIMLGFRPNHHITKDIATKIIKEKIESLDRAIMMSDFINIDKENEISVSIIKKHWGSFNNMLKEFSLPINQENMLENIKSKEEMLVDLQRLIDELGRLPVRDDFQNCLYIASVSSYHKKFGSINNAYLELGYSPNKELLALKFTNEELSNIYREFFDELGFTPSFDFCKQIERLPSPITLLRRLHCTWNEFVESLGYDANSSTSRGTITYATDGSICLSAAELFIHNYFLNNNDIEIIEKEYMYKLFIEEEFLINKCGYKRFDWLIKINNEEFAVEYFGFTGNKEYDVRTKEKLEIINSSSKKGQFITLYPSDLNKLDTIINRMLEIA